MTATGVGDGKKRGPITRAVSLILKNPLQLRKGPFNSPTDLDVNDPKFTAWLLSKIMHSSSVTGVAIAHLIFLVERDAKDPRHLTKEEEQMVTGIMGCQQRVWNVVLVMDTLLMSMTLPLLVVDGPNIDASMTDEGTNNVLLATYAVLLGVLFALVCLHLGTTIIFYVVTSYLYDVQDILWFLVTFHSEISYLNTLLLPINFLMMSAAVVGMSLQYGAWRTLPTALAMGGVIFLLLRFYARLRTRLVDRYRASAEQSAQGEGVHSLRRSLAASRDASRRISAEVDMSDDMRV